VPVLLEQVADRGDGVTDPADKRVTVLRIADRRLQDVLHCQGPVVPEHEEPRVDGTGDGRREGSGAGDELHAERAEVLDGRT
jgi:hypothetical protein